MKQRSVLELAMTYDEIVNYFIQTYARIVLCVMVVRPILSITNPISWNNKHEYCSEKCSKQIKCSS
jgi:hypothetical protein